MLQFNFFAFYHIDFRESQLVPQSLSRNEKIERGVLQNHVIAMKFYFPYNLGNSSDMSYLSMLNLGVIDAYLTIFSNLKFSKIF